ncbi:histidine--tRNA ligase [Candidatus Woesearchaeota archaeon]|nr:histidine--tRNA ligase [Candidatus Woesearchaeota archaeon]
MAFERVKGAADFYPEDKEAMYQIYQKLRDVARRYSFQEVESPAFETNDLLTTKSGEEIKNQIFTLEKRSKEELGLRFDLTVPQTRMFIAKSKELAKPIKWFSFSRMWRYEQPQKGRMREFYQANIELFGSDKPQADAELISLLIDWLTSLGLTEKDFFIKINNRDLLEGLLSDFVPKNKIEEAVRLIDKSSKITEKDFEAALKDAGIKNAEQVKEIIKQKGPVQDVLQSIQTMIKNEKAQQGYDKLKEVVELLDEKFIKIDLSVARGLAYYTGTVFECFDINEKYRAIAGGGRYDNMVQMFGGEKTPATGFAMGYSVLSLVLDERGLMPKPDLGPDYFVSIVNDSVREKAMEIVSKLRKQNKVDYDLSGRNLTNQFEYASSIAAKKTIIVGPKDLENNEVTVRDMQSGEEKKVKVEEL